MKFKFPENVRFLPIGKDSGRISGWFFTCGGWGEDGVSPKVRRDYLERDGTN